MRDGSPLLTPWDPHTMLGSYVDLLDGRLRVYGLPWQGAATLRSMDGLAHAMEAARTEEDTAGIEYRLLMMHTGLEGIVPRIQGLPSMSQFQPLRRQVDYLALGHVHNMRRGRIIMGRSWLILCRNRHRSSRKHR
jgi:hypothetical protein